MSRTTAGVFRGFLSGNYFYARVVDKGDGVMEACGKKVDVTEHVQAFIDEAMARAERAARIDELRRIPSTQMTHPLREAVQARIAELKAALEESEPQE